jgi:hypothetical protein
MARRRRKQKDLCDPLVERAAGLRTTAQFALREAARTTAAWRAIESAKRRYERALRRLFTPAQLRRYNDMRAAAARAKARLASRAPADPRKVADHRVRVRRQMAEFLESAGVSGQALKATKRALVRDVSAGLSRLGRLAASPAQGGE